MKNTVFMLLIVMVFVGGILRFWGNTTNPPELNIDEVSIGYNAYSILQTGKDEYGTFMPLSFKSVGDYKPPVLIYLTVPSIYFFGLNEFAIRFPVALISTIGILVLYLLVHKLTGNKSYALVAAGLYTISPWIIYYSRYGVEAMVATVFLCLGFYFMLHYLDKFSWRMGSLSAFFIVLSMYTYHSNRLFVPLFLLFILVTCFKTLKSNWQKLIAPCIFGFLLLLPLLINTIVGGDAIRAQSTFITRDIELRRSVLLLDENLDNNSYFQTLLIIQHGIRKYLNYFTPEFLFLNGLGMTKEGTYGLGVLYLFELPFVLFGAYSLFKRKVKNANYLLFWIVLGIIPAALTQNEQHPLRTLLIAPSLIIISAIGAVELYFAFTQKIRFILLSIFGLFVAFNLIYAISIFTVQFPLQKDENFMYGTKEAVLYALDHQSEYKEIIFDPVRGRDSGDVVSIPHMYILFYSKYDPAKYQKEEKRTGEDTYGFNKFTIRKINWPLDRRSGEGKLFIASKWSIPERDIQENVLKKKVYLLDGDLVFFIVSSENEDVQ